MTVDWDWEPADSLDREPADPEQVAFHLHALRRAVDDLVGSAGLPRWDDLTAPEQALGLAIGQVITDWIRDYEPDQPEDAARALHNVRRYWASSALPPWEDLAPDDRAVGVSLMALLFEWLDRQGALQ